LWKQLFPQGEKSMHICYCHGDIFTSSAQVLVNRVNVDGVMGIGLAAAFKNRFGAAYFQAYERDCATHRLRIGRPTLYRDEVPWILNFPTKRIPGERSRLTYIEQGLAYFSARYQLAGIMSIAFPKLGTGAGRLAWAEVGPIMAHFLGPLAQSGLIVYIYINQADRQYQQERVSVLEEISLSPKD
jgi:O-acetyl-ADP-ribose deacetylase (regulator of RNase III)